MRALAIVAALPWILHPIVAWWRARGDRSVADFPATRPDDAPLVSVVIPARDEAPRIERCVRSVLASSYAPLEVIVVDDHSDDGTGDIARRIAREDTRLRVIAPPLLPDGWFGKQWACATGAEDANGSLLLFTDADTHHARDLLPRAVNALVSLESEGLTIAGRQELGTFWERLVQPQMFAFLLARFGGTESMNRSRHASGKLANGQWLMLRRSAYAAIGGHAAVRDRAAEDLAIAQTMHRAGLRLPMLRALDHLSTRMYTSLDELVRGWTKNVWAGGIEATPGGRVGRLLYAPLLVFAALSIVVPPLVMLVAVFVPLPSTVLLWAALATTASLIWWLAIYHGAGVGAHYALAYPLGGVVLLVIFVRAIARGRRVEWKGRGYRARIAEVTD